MNKAIFYAPCIPTNWEIIPNKYLFTPHSKKVGKEFGNYNLLSLTKSGVILKDIESNEGKLPVSFEGYQTVESNDLIMCLFDLDVSAVFSGLSKYEGMITSAYDVFRVNSLKMLPKFADYWFENVFSRRSYSVYSKSLRHTIAFDSFKNIPTAVPPLDVQTKTVSFLNDKIEAINSLISNETKQIEKLKEYRQAIITKAVTKGLDSNAPMKDSGVEWIEKIPETWKVYPLKSMFSFGKGLPITKENLIPTGEKVISYGQLHAKYNISISLVPEMFRYVSNSYLQSNPECIVHKGDFIMADTSEDREGTCDFVHIDSSDLIFAGYHSIILRANNPLYSEYFAYLFLSDYWRDQFRRKVGGVKLFSLTKKMLSTGSVILPPEEDLYKIVTYLNSITLPISQVIDKKTSQIRCLEDYKESLIYEYVTGKKAVEA